MTGLATLHSSLAMNGKSTIGSHVGAIRYTAVHLRPQEKTQHEVDGMHLEMCEYDL
jgi:hypothetical protein